PWDYKMVLEDEVRLEDLEAPEYFKKWINSRTGRQQLDVEQRRWVWINLRQLLNKEEGGSLLEVESYLNGWFILDDMREATPYNNWYLRFPQSCPAFLFTQFKTMESINLWQAVGHQTLSI